MPLSLIFLPHDDVVNLHVHDSIMPEMFREEKGSNYGESKSGSSLLNHLIVQALNTNKKANSNQCSGRQYTFTSVNWKFGAGRESTRSRAFCARASAYRLWH
jgi:hypothetical protein